MENQVQKLKDIGRDPTRAKALEKRARNRVSVVEIIGWRQESEGYRQPQIVPFAAFFIKLIINCNSFQSNLTFYFFFVLFHYIILPFIPFIFFSRESFFFFFFFFGEESENLNKENSGHAWLLKVQCYTLFFPLK